MIWRGFQADEVSGDKAIPKSFKGNYWSPSVSKETINRLIENRVPDKTQLHQSIQEVWCFTWHAGVIDSPGPFFKVIKRDLTSIRQLSAVFSEVRNTSWQLKVPLQGAPRKEEKRRKIKVKGGYICVFWELVWISILGNELFRLWVYSFFVSFDTIS